MKLFKRRTKKAVVLGCGPAGLFAAHALAGNGWEVEIFSKKRKSHMYGAQYLHSPIAGLTVENIPDQVTYRLTGTVEGYRDKVYGSMPVKVSPEALTMKHWAWDVREAYDSAWERYGANVHDTPGIDVDWLYGLEQNVKPRLVVSTIPLEQLCHAGHLFSSVKVWALGDAPDRGQFAPYRPDPFTVECNGDPDIGWYRAANVFDHVTVEWPGRRKPPLPGVAEVIKPIYTDCTCFRSGEVEFKFVPLGRYGQWSKGVLLHHAYTQAAQL